MTKKGKSKWMRFIIKFVSGLIIFAVVALIIIYLYLGHIVKEAVTRFVPPITGTTAAVEDVDLSLLSGHVEIKGLKIGNPEGFSDNNIFELATVAVDFQPKSVLTPKIIIDRVLISGTKVSAELKNLYSLDSNIGVLQKNINSYLKTEKSAPKASPATKSAESTTPAKTVVIKDLKIQGTTLSVGASGQTISLPLPDIHQQNIGEEKKSKSIADIFADVLDMISIESLKGVAEGAKDLAKQGAQLATDLISDGASKISDGAKGAVQGIKDLFK